MGVTGRLFAVISLLCSLQTMGATVTICSEPGDGPPWLYRVRDAQGADTGKLAGFTPDFMRAAFGRLGVTVVFRGDLPWVRCLRMVAEGRIDFASGAYRDPGRERVFAYSQPYKTLTPQVFMSARRSFPIRTVKDLPRYRGCGMNGSSYAHYGLADKNLDLGARSYTALIRKLKVGYCDYFVEELEVIAQVNAGRDGYLRDPDLLHQSIEGADAPALHLVSGLKSKQRQLLPRFDQAVVAMKASGELIRIWHQHAGNVPF